MNGRTIEFVRPDGARAPGYLSEAGAEGAPGIVLFEEWWGLNDQIKETADRLAGDGFRVLVPDFYRGKVAQSREEAGHLAEGLDFSDVASQDAPGAAADLRARGSKRVGVMGFCMGGAVALIAGMHASGFDAIVTWYGLPPPEAGDPSRISIPVQGHWALHDEFFTPDKVDALEGKLKAGGVPHEFHRYDAGHAFYNPGGIGNYHRQHAETAWQRTVEFLRRSLNA